MDEYLIFLKDIGFKINDSYDHDQFHTDELVKGRIKVFFTTPLEGGKPTMDVELENLDTLYLTAGQILLLDQIINKTQQ
jgi:hypothetical protein|tara:strand:+ start:10294 stop:10530 length:237 start_codon:yes stop_codon:yes gene_type:complete